MRPDLMNKPFQSGQPTLEYLNNHITSFYALHGTAPVLRRQKI